MRIWHDDARPAPQTGWEWVRTNQEAIKWLQHRGLVEEISLDHDLGYHDVGIPDEPGELAVVMSKAGHGEETGLDLVNWMIEHDRVPPKVRIHSWNPDAAKRMAANLERHGHRCEVRPFSAQEMEAVLQQKRFYVRTRKETDAGQAGTI